MNNVYYRDFAGIVIANARAPQRFPENTGNEGAPSSGGDKPLVELRGGSVMARRSVITMI